MDELAYQAKAQFGIPKYPLVPVVAAVATVRTGYNVFAASAPKQLAKNHLPILFIHGAKDKFVPTKMAYENYRATSAPKKSFGSCRMPATPKAMRKIRSNIRNWSRLG